MFTFTKKNPLEFLVEQRAKSNEQRAKSNEQRAKNNEQRAKSNEQRVKSNEQQTKNNEQKVTSNKQRAKSFTFSKSKGANQVEIRLQNHAPLITFYH